MTILIKKWLEKKVPNPLCECGTTGNGYIFPLTSKKINNKDGKEILSKQPISSDEK